MEIKQIYSQCVCLVLGCSYNFYTYLNHPGLSDLPFFFQLTNKRLFTDTEQSRKRDARELLYQDPSRIWLFDFLNEANDIASESDIHTDAHNCTSSILFDILFWF